MMSKAEETRAGTARFGRASLRPGSRLAIIATVLLLMLGTLPGEAQTGTDEPTAEELQAERERLEAAEAENARLVDAASAELSEITDSLRTLQERVDAQAARVAYAQEQLEITEELVEILNEEVELAEEALLDLEIRLAEQAIDTFMADAGDEAAIAWEDDPNDIIRRQELLAQATQTDRDLVAELRAGRQDLEIRRDEALDAVDAAEALRLEAQERLAALESDQEAQQAAIDAAEDRLDHLLAERQALAALGEELDGDSAAEQELADELASGSPEPPSTPVNPPPVTGPDDIAYAGNGIDVNVAIVDDIRRLLEDSAADGVNLAGGGYRSPEAQIAVRRNNCGTSNYAIYEMPASQCRPPTARPGRSMHEQGLAIDFTCSGTLIRSRSGPCWNWLVANAARYGLQNLPSEPWHWSTNGR